MGRFGCGSVHKLCYIPAVFAFISFPEYYRLLGRIIYALLSKLSGETIDLDGVRGEKSLRSR